MAVAIPFIILAGTILSTAGAAKSGIDANNAAKFRAQSEVIAGNQAAGAADRAALNVRREGNLVGSRAMAVAAASGAGATDPTTLDIYGRIGAQTDYNAMSALYEGQDAQRAHNTQAYLDRQAGTQAETAGYLKAGSTLLSGASSLYGKYGSPSGSKASPSLWAGQDNSYANELA